MAHAGDRRRSRFPRPGAEPRRARPPKAGRSPFSAERSRAGRARTTASPATTTATPPGPSTHAVSRRLCRRGPRPGRDDGLAHRAGPLGPQRRRRSLQRQEAGPRAVRGGPGRRAAGRPGRTTPRSSVRAGDRLARDQAADGSWPLEGEDEPGSPATYGRFLATYLARESPASPADPDRFREPIDEGRQLAPRPRGRDRHRRLGDAHGHGLRQFAPGRDAARPEPRSSPESPVRGRGLGAVRQVSPRGLRHGAGRCSGWQRRRIRPIPAAPDRPRPVVPDRPAAGRRRLDRDDPAFRGRELCPADLDLRLGRPWPCWRLANPPYLPAPAPIRNGKLTVADFTRAEIGSTRSTSNGRPTVLPARSSSSVPISSRYSPGFQGSSPGLMDPDESRRLRWRRLRPRGCPPGSRTEISRRARAWSSGSGNSIASRLARSGRGRVNRPGRRGREWSRRAGPTRNVRRTERASGTPPALGQSLVDDKGVRLALLQDRTDLLPRLEPALDPPRIEQQGEPRSVGRPELLVQLQERIGDGVAGRVEQADVLVRLAPAHRRREVEIELQQVLGQDLAGRVDPVERGGRRAPR